MNLTRGQKVGSVLGVGVLALAVALTATQESVWAAAVFVMGLLLVTILVAGLVEKSNEPLRERLETRIEMLLKHACCGCGHKLERHRSPQSADGLGCLDCNCQAVHRLDEAQVEPYLGK
jgi:hypothetical protein